MDDIVRQFKGVSDGLMRKVVGSSSLTNEASPSFSGSGRNLSWHADEMGKHISRHSTAESTNSFSDNEEGEKDGSHGHEEEESVAQANGWHSDNELNSKGFPPRIIKRIEEFNSFIPEKKHGSEVRFDLMGPLGNPAASFPATSDGMEGPIGMPPEVSCFQLIFSLVLWYHFLLLVTLPIILASMHFHQIPITKTVKHC